MTQRIGTWWRLLPLLLGLVHADLGVATAADFHVDPAGNDANSGTSPAAPWQTLGKVNATTFAPGDRILFKRGGVWSGTLNPKGSGNASAQITLTAYGEGAKPLIDGAGAWAAIALSSQEYWTIDGFEVTNPGSGDSSRSGIRVDASGSQITHRIRILNNDVHDVRGIRNVNDGGRNNGAIFLWINEPGKADDILIQGNTVTTAYGQGIAFNAEAEYAGSGMDYNNCSSNVVVRGNKVLGTSGDGILLLGTDNELAECNEVGFVGSLSDDNNNIAAAWPTRHVNGIWQYNHVHDTVDRGNDSTAFDNDGFVKGTTYFQYNHTYNNHGGFFMEYQWGGDSAAKTIVRYNISVNESRIIASNRSGTELYNNVFYSPGVSFGMEWMGSLYFTFRNNIFWGSGWWSDYSSQTYQSNTFWGGIAPPSGATSSTNRNPLFVNPNSSGELAGFILQTNSPERSSGRAIAGNGGKDFWGAAVPVSPTRPHRGASQLNSITDYVPTNTYLHVTGPRWADIFPFGSNTVAFSVEVRDQNYRVVAAPTVAWSVSPDTPGFSIHPSNGVLTIASNAAPQRIAVVAACGGITNSFSVGVNNLTALSWNNGSGSGKWNASDVNWTGYAWLPGFAALFSHTASPATVTLEGANTAGEVTVGNGGNNANYTFTSAASGSLSAASLVLQGYPANDDTSEPTTTFDQAVINVAGNLGIGRARLNITGSSVVTAGTIGGGGMVTSADWGYLTLGGNATLVASNGIDGNTTAWGLNLNGGTLETKSINASEFHYHGAYLHFNGTMVRANQSNLAFVTVYGGSTAFIGPGGAILDTDGHEVGIGVSLADAATASPASNGGTTLGGAGFLEKRGSGTLILSAANSYSGGTTVSAGVLRVEHNAALGAAGSVTVVREGASLDLGPTELWDYTAPIEIVGNGPGGVGAISKSTNYNASVNQLRSIKLTGDASIGGVSGARIDVGRGDWGVNLVNAPVHIDGQGHTLSLVGGVYFGILAGAQNLAGLVVESGAAVAPHADNSFGDAMVTLNGGTLTPWGTHTFTNSFMIKSGYVDNQGFEQTYRGPVEVRGPAQVNAFGGSSISFNGAVSGTGSIRKIGANALILGGDNSGFTGAITNEQGALAFRSSAAGSATASWVAQAGTVLAAQMPGLNATVELGSLAGAGSLGNDSDNSVVTYRIGGLGTDSTFTGTIQDRFGGTANFTALDKVGAGTFTLTGASSYSGGTVVEGGTLELAGAAGGTGLVRGAVSVKPDATLALTGGDGTGFGWINSISSLVVDGATVNAAGGSHIGFGTFVNFSLTNGGAIAGSWQWNGDGLLGFSASGDRTNTLSGTITLRSDNGANHTFNVADGAARIDLLVDAVLSDQWPEVGWLPPSALVKAGAGTMVLAATNTYNGPTTLGGGTLVVQGALGTGAVLVAQGATLTGGGSLGGPVVNSGTVAPGTDVGALTVGGYSATTGAVLAVEIGGAGVPGSDYDRLNVTGSATLGGTLQVTMANGYTGTVGDTFILVSAAGGLSGSFNATNAPALADGKWWTGYPFGNAFVLAVTSAPAGGYAQYVATIADPAQRGYRNDPDGDGYPNLLEYATGGSATNSDAVARMDGVHTSGVLSLVFRRNTNAVDVTLVVEGSSSAADGSIWAGVATNANGSWGGAANVAENGSGSPVTVRVQDVAAPSSNRLLRLRVNGP